VRQPPRGGSAGENADSDEECQAGDHQEQTVSAHRQ
jgi:hypothetical protein